MNITKREPMRNTMKTKLKFKKEKLWTLKMLKISSMNSMLN